jgi:hypothetical protein
MTCISRTASFFRKAFKNGALPPSEGRVLPTPENFDARYSKIPSTDSLSKAMGNPENYMFSASHDASKRPVALCQKKTGEPSTVEQDRVESGTISAEKASRETKVRFSNTVRVIPPPSPFQRFLKKRFFMKIKKIFFASHDASKQLAVPCLKKTGPSSTIGQNGFERGTTPGQEGFNEKTVGKISAQEAPLTTPSIPRSEAATVPQVARPSERRFYLA